MRPETASATPAYRTFPSQAGAGMLGIVALLGLTFALVQGALFYRSRASAGFIASEKNKILAQQAAEAGVEENIADLGTRKLRPYDGMHDFPTYTGRSVGAGTFSTSLTLLSRGAEADTLELRSQGRVSSCTQSVRAKLKVKRHMDTSLVPIMLVDIDTFMTPRTVSTPETTVTTVVMNPAEMPPLNTTPAYAACLSGSAKRCDVCHIPPGLFENRHVININKNSIDHHLDCHGDYVTTDGTCDLYQPREERRITWHSITVMDTALVDNTLYDTVVVIDTLARVRILSWK
jgi:hypothetical protein